MLPTTRFMGLDCLQLENASVSLLVTRPVGPRVLALRLHGQESPFAELPDFGIDCPGRGRLRLWGGHRLWHAPELAARTYLPDDEPPEIVEIEGGVLMTQLLEEPTGLQKWLRITLSGDRPVVIVDHGLVNQGLWPVRCALWAITQVRPGGVAILPQADKPADADGLLPNRRLAMWPYTDPGSAHVTWGRRFVLVQAALQQGAFKIGFPNPHGWLAYHRAGTLFVKRARFETGGDYLDLGSSSEFYANKQFAELETLSPATTIPPGGSAQHREVWELYSNVTFAGGEEAAAALAASYRLDEGSEFLQG